MTQFLKNENEIRNWLDNQGVNNYQLVPDTEYGYAVNVVGNVNLSMKNLSFIPVKFHEVSGDFKCNDNSLFNLEGVPNKVGGNFSCAYNKLVSLEFCPQEVGQSFYCHNNFLTSLEHSPSIISLDFLCDNNQLTNLIGSPQEIGRTFWCHSNLLTTLEGCPKKINFCFGASDNQLSTLEFFPEYVKDEIDLSQNPHLNNVPEVAYFQTIYKIHLAEVQIKTEKKTLFEAIQSHISNKNKNHKI